MKHLYVFVFLWTLTLSAYAQEAEVNFTADDPAQKLREQLNLLIKPLTEKDIVHREKSRRAVCNAIAAQPTPSDEWRSSLATVTSDIKADVLFETKSDVKGDSLPRFSVHLEFEPKRVLVRHSHPRFPGDVAGIWIPFPKNSARQDYLEGKSGSDLLVITPDFGECSTQAILICPRTFVPRYSLSTTPYKATSAQFPAAASAEGIVAMNTEDNGESFARIQVSKTLKAPENWNDRASGASMTVGVKHNFDPGETDENWSRVQSEPPFIGSIRSSVGFLRSGKDARYVSKTATISIEPFNLEASRKFRRLGNVLDISPGQCWLATKEDRSQ